MRLGGLYDQHWILLFKAICRELWLSHLCAIVDLLLYNSNCIVDLKTIEINILICVMTLIYFVENLPSYVPVYLLLLVFVLLIWHHLNILLLVVIITSVHISLRISVFDVEVLIVLASDALKLVGDANVVILNQDLLILHGHFPTTKCIAAVSLTHGFANLHALNHLLVIVALFEALWGPECRN